MKAVKLDKANSLTHTILIEMQITRKQTSDQSKSSDSALILNKHGVRVYPAETIARSAPQIADWKQPYSHTKYTFFFFLNQTGRKYTDTKINYLAAFKNINTINVLILWTVIA